MTENRKIAIYIRLSIEDENVDGRTKKESDSVTKLISWNMWMMVSVAHILNARVFNSCRKI